MTSAPLWLESAEILQLLNLFVNRLDAADQRRSASLQSVSLNERTWPALYLAAFESDKETLWEQAKAMNNWGWFEIKPAAAARSPSGYALSPRISILDEKAIRQIVGRPERVRSALERWREAVTAHLNAPDEAKRLAGDYCIDIPDRSMGEVVQQLNRLKGMASESMLLREVSARLFWGMSKVLDNRQGLVSAVLGVSDCPFAESPIQMQVYLPLGGFDSVLFIENQMTFEQAIRSRSELYDGVALVYASGFKASARRLREDVSLYFSQRGELSGEARQRFVDWMGRNLAGAKAPAYFWGDLDWSGMRILRALRASFPDLTAWQPGYALMRSALLNGEGHPPEAADKTGQAPLTETGCSFADSTLLPALVECNKFVDQEAIKL